MSENYTDFLLAVVNAEERADFRGARKRFAHVYSEGPNKPDEPLPLGGGGRKLKVAL